MSTNSKAPSHLQSPTRRRVPSSALGAVLSALSAGTIVASASAAGPNLVTNGEFNSDTGAWSEFYNETTVSWEAGKIAVHNVKVGPSFSNGGVIQCIPGIEGGETYRAQLDSMSPLQPRQGTPGVTIEFFSDDFCQDYADGFGLGISAEPGKWRSFQHVMVAPESARSMSYTLHVQKYSVANGGGQDSDPYTALFDHVSLVKLDPDWVNDVQPEERPGKGNPVPGWPFPLIPEATPTPAVQPSATPAAASTPASQPTSQVDPGTPTSTPASGDPLEPGEPLATQPTPLAPATGEGAYLAPGTSSPIAVMVGALLVAASGLLVAARRLPGRARR